MLRVDFPELLSCLYFTKRGLPFVFAPKTLTTDQPLVYLWCGRTDGRSSGRCTVTWLPNFLGWVVHHIFLPMVLRCARDSSAITSLTQVIESVAKWSETAYESHLSRHMRGWLTDSRYRQDTSTESTSTVQVEATVPQGGISNPKSNRSNSRTEDLQWRVHHEENLLVI